VKKGIHFDGGAGEGKGKREEGSVGRRRTVGNWRSREAQLRLRVVPYRESLI